MQKRKTPVIISVIVIVGSLLVLVFLASHIFGCTRYVGRGQSVTKLSFDARVVKIVDEKFVTVIRLSTGSPYEVFKGDFCGKEGDKVRIDSKENNEVYDLFIKGNSEALFLFFKPDIVRHFLC